MTLDIYQIRDSAFSLGEERPMMYICARYAFEHPQEARRIFKQAASEILSRKRTARRKSDYDSGFEGIMSTELTDVEIGTLRDAAASELRTKGLSPDYLDVDILMEMGKSVSAGLFLGRSAMASADLALVEALVGVNLIAVGGRKTENTIDPDTNSKMRRDYLDSARLYKARGKSGALSVYEETMFFKGGTPVPQELILPEGLA